MKYSVISVVIVTALSLAPTSSWAKYASSQLTNLTGATVGEVEFTQTPHGLLLRLSLFGLPPGAHAVHVHAVGSCEPPFKSAGGHFNPDQTVHGLLTPEGPHAGDLPNIHMPKDGSLLLELFAPQLSLEAGPHPLLGADGATIIVHTGADDYTSAPAGNAGPPLACGVIRGSVDKPQAIVPHNTSRLE